MLMQVQVQNLSMIKSQRNGLKVFVKALLNQYNISSDRITYDSKGSRVQPFSENDKNRVSIFVAE